MELILMWIPMHGVKFRDFMSVVCTSNWNGPASAKLNKGKNCFVLVLVPVSKGGGGGGVDNVVMVIWKVH